MTTIVLPHESREEWLAQRRDYITASQAAAIFTSPSSWGQVKAEHEGVQTFAGNRFTEWGHEREPALIGWFAEQFPEEHAGPNDELHVLLGTSWAATPDGVSETCVVDAKTGSSEGLAKSHGKYLAQLQWQMLVCGVDRGYLVYELREDGEDGFAPGEKWIERHDRDDDLIEQMMHTCHRFLDGADFDLDIRMERYFNAKAERDKHQQEMDEIADEFKADAAGDPWTYAGPLGSVKVSPASTSQRLDTAALKAAHPELVSEFTKPVASKPRVTFTEKKGA